MERISPVHPAVKRLAVALCERLAAWQEVMWLQAPRASDAVPAQSSLPSDTRLLLRPQDVYKLLGRGETQVEELLRFARMPHVKHGRVYKIPRPALERRIEKESSAR